MFKQYFVFIHNISSATNPLEKLHVDMKIPKHDMLQEEQQQYQSQQLQQQQYQQQQQQQEPLQQQPHVQQSVPQASTTDMVPSSGQTALMRHSALMPAIGARSASKTGK